MLAGTFNGDEPKTGQRHLDFQAYDFSFIPIETLSSIYEQFLHTGNQQGKNAGAYYTPVSLVNFMLTELEARHPLKKGMKTLDPSCGSGAFLVQVYRRIIEKERLSTNKRLKPSELRELLIKHI